MIELRRQPVFQEIARYPELFARDRELLADSCQGVLQLPDLGGTLRGLFGEDRGGSVLLAFPARHRIALGCRQLRLARQRVGRKIGRCAPRFGRKPCAPEREAVAPHFELRAVRTSRSQFEAHQRRIGGHATPCFHEDFLDDTAFEVLDDLGRTLRHHLALRDR